MSAGYGPISAELSAEFSAGITDKHAISFTKQTTRTEQFDLPANTFIQVWQLQMQIVADTNGSSLTENVPVFQSLTYPASAGSLAKEKVAARARARLEALLAARSAAC